MLQLRSFSSAKDKLGVLAVLLLVGAILLPLTATTTPAQEIDHPFFDNDGGNVATTVQLPTFGVAIDAAGVLTRKTFEDPTGKLRARRAAAAKAALAADIVGPTRLRKVSLQRLERAVRRRLDAGQPPDEAMRNLAGLLRLKYVFFYPRTGDIVIAGPAEGWAPDAAGRTVGLVSGRPVLRLEDLVVALRAFPPGGRNRPFVGCTINPTQQGLARLREFQKKIPGSISPRQRASAGVQIAKGMRDSLGMADIRTFGVPADTHFAQVLIEADYRMKLIGIGLEQSPVKMTSFIGALKSARQAALQRWWFTPNYDCVKMTKDRLAMELVGLGVQLQGEDKVIGPDGRLLNSKARPNRASEAFTASFTRVYPQLAARSPIYAQMRNLIDMLVAAAFIQQQDYYGRAGWEMATLGDERAIPTRNHPAPKQAACAANSVWKGARLLAPAGGGVSILPHKALAPERILADRDGKLAAGYKKVAEKLDPDRWWWD